MDGWDSNARGVEGAGGWDASSRLRDETDGFGCACRAWT